MQLEHITRPIKKETVRLVKFFLTENPDLLKKYVDGGMTVVGLALSPLNTFMRHLLTIQGLDPDTVPGENERRLLQEILDNMFQKDHDKDFDTDYDMTWVQKRFEETRKRLNQLELTKEKFLKLTDLDKLPNDGPSTIDKGKNEEDAIVNQIAPESAKREIRIIPTAQEREDFKDALINLGRIAGETIKDSVSFDPGNALQQLQEAAEKAGVVTKKNKKSGIKVNQKKLHKGGKGTKVHRIPTVITEEAKFVDNKISLHDEVSVKAIRAQQLVEDMVAFGLVPNTETDKHRQLTEIMKFNSDALESLERVVKRHSNLTNNKFAGPFKRTEK